MKRKKLKQIREERIIENEFSNIIDFINFYLIRLIFKCSDLIYCYKRFYFTEELKSSAGVGGATGSTTGRFPSSSLVLRLTDHLTTAGAFLLARRGLTSEDSDWLLVSHMSEVPAVHRTALRQYLLPYVCILLNNL